MKRLYRTLAFLVIPLCALRLYDTLFNIDPKSGYFKNGFNIFYILSFIIIFAAFVWLMIKGRKSTVTTTPPSADGFTGIVFCICALLTAAASLLLMSDVFGRVELSHIFMSRKELFSLNIIDTHFRIEFWVAAVGFIAAVWFAYAAYRFFKDGNVSKRPIFCGVIIVWFCLRALSDFSIAPVNPNDTIILTRLFADLILALFFLKFLRFASIGYPAEETKKLMPYAFLAFAFVVSFKAPLLLIVSLTNAFLIGVDLFASIAAFAMMGQLIKGD